jgi:putative addiction module component (TIGR02574 family)
MSQDLKELEQRISQLDATDKARLVLFLLESLEPADDGDVEEAWRIEAEARLDAVERGEADTVSADDVFAKLSRHFP